MEISYYPGCTLKTKAINFETSALALLEKLDVKAIELKDWNCCGVMFSQSQDNLMKQLAPIRTLIRAKESGRDRLLTLCSMCYNTLKRSALFIQENEDKRDKINDFMDLEETEYFGNEIEVVNILTLLDEIDKDKLKASIVKDAKDLKVATYYGCLLTRPKEVAIDNVEDPQIMENLLEAAGCKPVYFPFKTECCASFQVVSRKDIARERTRKIVDSARKNGAEMILLACPLCEYNLDKLQKELNEEASIFETLPFLYVTQLLAILAGVDPEINDYSKHYIDPRPVLERKGLL